MQAGASTGAPDPEAIVEREGGLHQDLSPRQVAMIGLGSTIGTGLFLGSAISVKLAGPAVILSFLGGSLIALTVMWALAEMTAEHPAAGSFGLHAEIYLHPWAGFAVRYTYWLCLVVVVGSEVVAAAIYCKLWFPGIPSWIWVAAFSATIVYVNTISVKRFGRFEYWFAMIKVVTVAVFLVLGTALLLGIGFPRIGTVNYTGQGGFFPNGKTGVLLGITMAVFSFLGIEIVAATAGEAVEPRIAVPKALRRTLFFLVLFYLGGLTLVVGLVPWNQIGLGESPFVRVFQTVGIPAAGLVMNFVVLTAALEQTGYARPGCAGLECRNGRGGISLPLFRSDSFRLHDRRGILRRAFHLDHDSDNTSSVPARQCSRGKNGIALRASWSLELAVWPCRAFRGAHLYLVGSRLSCNASGRPSLAGLHNGVLLGLVTRESE